MVRDRKYGARSEAQTHYSIGMDLVRHVCLTTSKKHHVVYI